MVTGRLSLQKRVLCSRRLPHPSADTSETGFPFWNSPPPNSEIFQLRLHEAVKGLDGVYVIADDILVAGTRETMQSAIADHDVKIKKLLTRCRERSIKLNKQKVAFKQTEVPYIGNLLTSTVTDYFSSFFEIDRLYHLKATTVIERIKAHML